jgi:proline dehydrogenase
MDNVTEIVSLLRKQAELESQIENGDVTSAVDAEQELERTRRRLSAHPHALRAVLNTARALRRSPDTVTVQQVTEFGGSG